MTRDRTSKDSCASSVRVGFVSVQPLPQSVLLALLVAVAGMALGLPVEFDVAWYAKSLKVPPVVAEVLHLADSVNRFDRSSVVDIHRTSDDALLLASLAEWMGLNVFRPELLPPAVVQQSLVFLTSAHPWCRTCRNHSRQREAHYTSLLPDRHDNCIHFVVACSYNILSSSGVSSG